MAKGDVIKPRLPKILYHVAVVQAGEWQYADRKGGTFANREAAFARKDKIDRSGGKAAVFVSVQDWQEVVDE